MTVSNSKINKALVTSNSPDPILFREPPREGGVRPGRLARGVSSHQRATASDDTRQITFGDITQGETLLYPDIGQSIIRSKVTPGYSEPKENCGKVKYLDTCSRDPDHYQKPVQFHCKRAACPTCWTTWANREADSLVDLIEGYESASRSAYHARHVSLSPSAEIVNEAGYTWASPEALKWLYDTANDLLDELGITAAAVIAHPYRIKPEYKRIINDEASQAGVNRYTWALSQPDWFEYVYFSPHLHLLCFGKMLDADVFQGKTGWIYRNHKSRSGEDLQKTIHYLLSHCWVQGNSRIVRTWRGMSNRNLGVVVLSRLRLPAICPHCGSPRVQVYTTHPGQLLIHCEPVLEWVETRGYYLKARKKKVK